MANETRPRREPTGTSRIRKTSSTTPASAPPEDADGAAGGAAAPLAFGAGASDPMPPAGPEPVRDRKDREPPFREEGPADREPIRYLRERERPDREPIREPVRERTEREPVITVRERLARDRAERENTPIHHEGIPVRDRDRDRDRDREPSGAPLLARAEPRPGADPVLSRSPRTRGAYVPRDRDRDRDRDREFGPPVRVERTAPAPGYGDVPVEFPDEDEEDIFGDAAIHDRYEDIKRGEIHLTELQKMTMPQLIRTAKTEGIDRVHRA